MAQLTAQWGAQRFIASGQVTGEGAEAAGMVRLTFADGAALTDQVHNGIVRVVAG